MTQGRIWHALQLYQSMLTILVPCNFTPSCDPPCTRLISVSTLGVFIRPQWTVRYPQNFYIFTMQVDVACPLGKSKQLETEPQSCGHPDVTLTASIVRQYLLLTDYSEVIVWKRRWLFLTDVFLWGSVAPEEKYLGPIQSLTNSHNERKNDGAELLLSSIAAILDILGHFRCNFPNSGDRPDWAGPVLWNYPAQPYSRRINIIRQKGSGVTCYQLWNINYFYSHE